MSEPKFEHLTDREILILTCKETFSNSARLDSHASRIRTLEQWRSYLAGATAVILSLCSLLAFLEKTKR